MDGKIDGWIYVYGRMDEQIDGRMYEQIDRQIDIFGISFFVEFNGIIVCRFLYIVIYCDYICFVMLIVVVIY